MNKYYSKCTKRNNNGFGNKQHNYKKNNYYKRNQYNNYINYNRKKKINYDIYEEEIPYEKETTLSTNDPSTKDGSFSQSSNSNSRKQSFSEYNNEYYNDNSEKNKDSSIIILEDNSKINNIPKINLSEDVLKTAFYKPKNYKESPCTKNEYKKAENIDNNDNITILEINVKIAKDKFIYFKLRKYDDMFQVVKDTCKKNEMSEEYFNFFIRTIIKALNSIYGIYNLSLKDEEKKVINNLRKKYNDN